MSWHQNTQDGYASGDRRLWRTSSGREERHGWISSGCASLSPHVRLERDHCIAVDRRSHYLYVSFSLSLSPFVGLTATAQLASANKLAVLSSPHFTLCFNFNHSLAGFASAVSLVSYGGGSNLGIQQDQINRYMPVYFFRSAATIGAILMTYYADRYPLSKVSRG